MIKGLEWKKISELVDIFNNIRVPLSSKERENLNKMFPYYGAQGIVDYVDDFLFDGEYLLVAEDGENLRSNNQNICNLVKGKFWVNNHAHILKANDDNITKYLFYNFNRIKFDSYVTGSAQPKLNKENLLNIKTCVHSKVDQQKITSVLSALDDKIELNNRINSELEAMAKLLYEYWFVQFDFPYDLRQSKPADETSKPQDIKPYKSSGGKMVWNKDLNREIPEGWGSGFLNDLGKIIGGSTPSRNNPEFFTEDGIPWITPKDLSNNVGNKYIFKGESDVTQKGKDNASLNILPKGTILMSSRAPIGYVAISVCDVTTNQGFKSFIPEDPFTTEFVFYKLNEMMPVIENNASGSTFKEVSAGTLKTIKIVLPPEKVIQSFTSKVSPVFKKQENLQIQNQELSSLRDWLLPMLMNGQVTVEDAEERVNEELGMVAEGERGRYEKK